MRRRLWTILFILLTICPVVLADIEPVYTSAGLAAGEKTVGTAVRYMRVGMWDKAERELRQTLGYRPDNHAAQYNLGLCMERKGKTKLARRFYEKAIDIRPENLYCEAIARMDGVLGTGAEFLKFMIPCQHRCDYGYAFARAGLWREAEARFAAASQDYPDATNALNRAVASEVLGRREQAARYLARATSLKGSDQYNFFYKYLNTAPDFPLDMLVTLPDLTTTTNIEPGDELYVKNNNTSVRLGPGYLTPVIAMLTANSKVVLLNDDRAWFRVRTKTQKEGYIPGLLLASEPVPDTKVESTAMFSLPFQEDVETEEPADPTEQDPETEEPTPIPIPEWVARVKKDGNPVAVRAEMSLLAEIVGYVDPGRKIRVTETGDNLWLEIISGRVKGYILRSYVETNSP